MIAGMVAVHLNGTLARVIFSPTEDSPLVGVAFWLEDGRLMQMAWQLDWIADWYDDITDTVQLELF